MLLTFQAAFLFQFSPYGMQINFQKLKTFKLHSQSHWFSCIFTVEVMLSRCDITKSRHGVNCEGLPILKLSLSELFLYDMNGNECLSGDEEKHQKTKLWP